MTETQDLATLRCDIGSVAGDVRFVRRTTSVMLALIGIMVLPCVLELPVAMTQDGWGRWASLWLVLTCVACGIGYYVYRLRIGRVNYRTLERLCAYGLMAIAVVAAVHALVLLAATSKSRSDAQDALIATLALYGLLLVWVGFLWAIGRKGRRLVEFRLDDPLGLPVSLLGPGRDAFGGTADRHWAIPPLRRWPSWLLFSAAALIFKFLGLAMAAFLGALTQGLAYLISIAPNLMSMLGRTLCKPLFELGEKCAYRSRQYAAVDARDLMSADRRPPILLLRSFADDNRAAVETKLIDWMAQSGRTFEEVLTEQLARYGPVVAIGRPGEKLPTAGAAREYLADDRWRQRVEELVAQSSAIVLLAGTTPNVGWELARIELLGAIYKLVLVVPAANKYEVASRMSVLLSNIAETRIGELLADHMHTDALAAQVTPKAFVEIVSQTRFGRDYEAAVNVGLQMCRLCVPKKVDCE